MTNFQKEAARMTREAKEFHTGRNDTHFGEVEMDVMKRFTLAQEVAKSAVLIRLGAEAMRSIEETKEP